MSAAGEALTMLPPRVPRFWLAMEPVQLAAWVRSGKSLGDGGVVADVGEGGAGADGDGVGGDVDEAELVEVLDGEEVSGLRRPAPRATMSSVPPAMGV